jgi:Fe2+ or Zn2+ uptake regulation protein
MRNVINILRDHGIQPTPQRIAVVMFILAAKTHPSADEVWSNVLATCPTISRATVYNTLNLLVEKGLLKAQILKEGTVVFDAHVQRHHHFIDEETGKIYDIPWEDLQVRGQGSLPGFEVSEYQVILRGKKRKS